MSARSMSLKMNAPCAVGASVAAGRKSEAWQARSHGQNSAAIGTSKPPIKIAASRIERGVFSKIA